MGGISLYADDMVKADWLKLIKLEEFTLGNCFTMNQESLDCALWVHHRSLESSVPWKRQPPGLIA